MGNKVTGKCKAGNGLTYLPTTMHPHEVEVTGWRSRMTSHSPGNVSRNGGITGTCTLSQSVYEGDTRLNTPLVRKQYVLTWRF